MSTDSRTFTLQAEAEPFYIDTLTPVSLYLRLRDRHPGTVLLESTDYQPNDNCWSYLCFDALASFTAGGGEIACEYPDRSSQRRRIQERSDVLQSWKEFFSSFSVRQSGSPGICNGLFGYCAYDAVEFFESLSLMQQRDRPTAIPSICYVVFRGIVAINHYRQEAFLLENIPAGEERRFRPAALRELLHKQSQPRFRFRRVPGTAESVISDEEHAGMIERCKQHVFRGDVFQIVLSRRYSERFEGDEFNVYRALRLINPSPYLFFFDFGGYRLFGSSPEAQLVVKDGKAAIFPIAGTCGRSSDPAEEARLIEALLADPKENAEHVMLVDLARNDLSKHCDRVFVERFRDVHRYSHVIHLVSKVVGDLSPDASTLQLIADTFPAGTLSGAPKYRAMQLIDAYEKGRRGFYGGAIGFLGFDGGCNHAIMIRSFMSRDKTLYSQAGSGIVADSDPLREVQEVKNKLAALEAAAVMGEEL